VFCIYAKKKETQKYFNFTRKWRVLARGWEKRRKATKTRARARVRVLLEAKKPRSQEAKKPRSQEVRKSGNSMSDSKGRPYIRFADWSPVGLPSGFLDTEALQIKVK
jgi:hypothetical protein